MHAPDTSYRWQLSQAINDIQGSIHANDNKSAAGLIVHGLLATAVLTVITHLGTTYHEATDAAQVLIKLWLILALAAGASSIAAFLYSVTPYEPIELRDRIRRHHAGVYFPDLLAMRSQRNTKPVVNRPTPDEFDQLHNNHFKLLALGGADDPVDAEYLAQLLLVADIRLTLARRAKRAFALLALEIAFVTLFLATAGLVAGRMLGAARADAPPHRGPAPAGRAAAHDQRADARGPQRAGESRTAARTSARSRMRKRTTHAVRVQAAGTVSSRAAAAIGSPVPSASPGDFRGPPGAALPAQRHARAAALRSSPARLR